MGKTMNNPQDLGRAAVDCAEDIKGTAQDLASVAAGRANEVASEVAGAVSGAAAAIGKSADKAAATVGSGMKSLAGTIHDHAPDHGMAGAASSAVARGLDEGGEFLKEKGVTGMGNEFAALVRNHPLPTLLVGIGLGYLLARAHRNG